MILAPMINYVGMRTYSRGTGEQSLRLEHLLSPVLVNPAPRRGSPEPRASHKSIAPPTPAPLPPPTTRLILQAPHITDGFYTSVQTIQLPRGV